jgi:hypothetical protein
LTKRERYLAALRCEEPDRVPIVVRGVDPLHDVAGLPASNHPSFKPLIRAAGEKTEWAYRWHPPEEHLLSSAPEAVVRTEIRASDKEGFEERVTTYETPLGPLQEFEYISPEGKPGMMKKYPIESGDDVERFFSIPYRFKRPDTSLYFGLTKRMGENGVVMASIGDDPIGHLLRWIGLETLAVWSKSERETILRLLDEFYRRCELLVKALLEDNVGPVFATLGMEAVTPPWFSKKDFYEFVTRYDERLWAPIRDRGCIIHVHCHGGLKTVIDDFIRMGASCLHPVEAPPMGDLELQEAKQMVSGKICIEGNIQLDHIYSRDEESVRELVRKAICDAATGGGFVLCPTASPIPPVLTEKVLQNYLAFIEAGLEFGKIY